jgi:hypothetical protein
MKTLCVFRKSGKEKETGERGKEKKKLPYDSGSVPTNRSEE